jgi:hypothetical protein
MTASLEKESSLAHEWLNASAVVVTSMEIMKNATNAKGAATGWPATSNHGPLSSVEFPPLIF